MGTLRIIQPNACEAPGTVPGSEEVLSTRSLEQHGGAYAHGDVLTLKASTWGSLLVH